MISKAFKIVIIAVLGFVISTFVSKANEIDDFFDKYSDLDNATYVNITPSPDLLETAVSMGGEQVNTPEMKKLIKNIKSIKILTIEQEAKELIDKIYNEAQKIFKVNTFKKFLEVKEKNEKVMIYYKGEKSNVEEFLLMVREKEELTIIWIKGNIDLKDLPKIQGMFNGSNNPHKGK